MSLLSQKRFLFRLSEVAVPVSVIEMNFGKCRFFASAITNLCSSDKAIVLWWWRHFLNAPRKQTWTVRKQLAIKASLVFARFWNCEGGNRRLRWLCRTSTDWIWESQILRAANLREGNKTHFTKSYFMQFVPTEIRTTGRCICIRTSYNNNTQARRSRVRTNFTCLLATLECSFIQV